MTMQVSDKIHFDEVDWAVQGINGSNFFEPHKFGLDVAGGYSTACYDGYRSTYRVHKGQLQLVDLEIHLDEKTTSPLNGHLPTKNSIHDVSLCGNYTYSDVQLPVPFSGGLLLCREWLKQLPSSIGPELAWRFEKIRELIFEDGNLVQSYDHSDAVEKIRAEIGANGGEIPITVNASKNKGDIYAQYENLEAKINACFKLTYSSFGGG